MTRKPRRSKPYKTPRALFEPGVHAETSGTILHGVGFVGFPPHTDPLTTMMPLDRGWGGRLMVWKAVTEAFALELYLKTLAVLDYTTHLRNVHNHRALFDDLKPGTAAAVREEHAKIEQQHPGLAAGFFSQPCNRSKAQTFDTLLDESSDAFTVLRYPPSGGAHLTWIARSVMISARRVIVERRPDLAKVAEHLVPTPPSAPSTPP